MLGLFLKAILQRFFSYETCGVADMANKVILLITTFQG
jgi:hypothetical protein